MTYDPSGRDTVRTVFVDADDTLWESNIYYLRCLAEFQEYMESYGCAPEASEGMLHLCELETISRYGYGPQGYLAALGMACRRLLAKRGVEADDEAIEGAERIGELVLSPPMVLIPDVENTLEALRPSSMLVLLTKGDPQTQNAKIRRSGLAPLFDRQYIVPEKDADTYRRLVAELATSPRTTWMVGNSPKSDINPACQAGLGAILIPHNHTWVAELQELESPERVITLQRFSDLPAFFGIEDDAAQYAV